MKLSAPLRLVLFFFIATVPRLALADNSIPATAVFTEKQVRQYLQMQQMLYPAKGDFYNQFLKKFPGRKTFTAYELMSVTDPDIKIPNDYKTKPVQTRTSPLDSTGNPKVLGMQLPIDSISKEDARRQLMLAERQKLGDQKLFNALKAHYGDQDWYTTAQVNEIVQKNSIPPKPTPSPKQKDHIHIGNPPPGAISARDAAERLSEVEIKALEQGNYVKTLESRYGVQDYYTAQQIRDVEDSPDKPGTVTTERSWPDLVAIAATEQKGPHTVAANSFGGVLIRQNWRDVLYSEDLSLPPGDGKQVLGDLTGATFSYTDNRMTGTDSWSAIGALILPWQFSFDPSHSGGLQKLALAPSVSIDEVEGASDPTKDVDTLLYRVGIYSDWNFTGTKGPPLGLQARLAGVYASDTGGHGSLPGAELDLEPRFQMRGSLLALGYKKILIHKEARKADLSDISFLEYQLRCWVHAEGGNVQGNGATWDSTKGQFFRAGPEVQLQLRFPELVWNRDFSVTALYSNLARLSGSDLHRSFFKITASLDLLKDDVTKRKIAVTADYENGGLDLTKEKVDIFMLGLSVLY